MDLERTTPRSEGNLNQQNAGTKSGFERTNLIDEFAVELGWPP